MILFQLYSGIILIPTDSLCDEAHNMLSGSLHVSDWIVSSPKRTTSMGRAFSKQLIYYRLSHNTS